MAGEERRVGGTVDSIGVADARSALAWWLQAGVDVAIQDQPRDWLKPAPAKTPERSEPTPPPNVTRPDHETLAELQEWLATNVQLPLASSAAKRILPHGPENAVIMLLSDAPSLEDYASGSRSAATPGSSRRRCWRRSA